MNDQDAKTFVEWLTSRDRVPPTLQDPELAEVARSIADKSGQDRIVALQRELERLNDNGESIRSKIGDAVREVYGTGLPSLSRTTDTDGPRVPELPGRAQLAPELGRTASSWLDNYVAYSRKWSPRAFDGFHEACGLWSLSTVAAGRVMLHLGGSRYTPLFILLAARTSLFAKSTTAGIAIEVLKQAGLDWFLAADAATPEKFLNDLTFKVPDDYEQFQQRHQTRIVRRLAFAGQRGWFYEEFGQQIHAMHRRNGPMADFRGIIRRFDDCRDRYEYGSVSRGSDIVEKPYLALLGSLTPADLRPFAKKDSAMWNDGFWARFAFVTPGGIKCNRARFPPGERVIPTALWQPLKEWHEKLGVPEVRIEEVKGENGKPIGKKPVLSGAVNTLVCTLGEGVCDAYYNYHDGLLSIMEGSGKTDLDGNYARFAEKALRIAMLLAGLENDGRIEMCHWARAQQITERWRSGLHALYEQVNEPEPSEAEQMEERVLDVIQRHGEQTAAQVSRFVRGLDTAGAEDFLTGLVRAGVLETHKTHRSAYYRFPESEP